MLTSMQKLPKLALPMLSAMLLLSLLGNPSSAEAPRPLASRSAPGQVVETIGTAATVVETVHYQAKLTLTCENLEHLIICYGAFPKPRANRRLNVTRMSCALYGTSDSTVKEALLQLRRADGWEVLAQWLPIEDSNGGVHKLNRAVDVQVNARQHLFALFHLASGSGNAGFCTAVGTQDTLQ